MKNALIFLLLTSLTTGAFAQATTDQDPAGVTTAFFKAMLEEDAGAIDKLLTDDFMIVNNDGQTADKSLLGQALSGGYLVVDTGAASNVSKPRIYNSDAAVVTGNWKQKGSLQGQAFSNELVFTVLCAKTGSTWKIANVQFSTVAK
ncbi:MAG: nuclear transport factor 2 family protein [Bacteroidetes bacterium]|nr:nuclear transport factor 2 family protein [Fibrella sp.]